LKKKKNQMVDVVVVDEIVNFIFIFIDYEKNLIINCYIFCFF